MLFSKCAGGRFLPPIYALFCKIDIRVVPCGAVTGEGILLGFIPEKVEVKTKTRVYINDYCVIAVLNKQLSEGEYRALLNEKILQNSREEKRIESNVF